jgi:hypothetical protein
MMHRGITCDGHAEGVAAPRRRWSDVVGPNPTTGISHGQAADIVSRNAVACQTHRRAINRRIPWGFRRCSRVCFFRGAVMMGRAPHAPVDLAALTRDIKSRCARASGNIELIAQSKDPIFQDPRQIMLELVLARHEIEAAISIMKKGWWGP